MPLIATAPMPDFTWVWVATVAAIAILAGLTWYSGWLDQAVRNDPRIPPGA